MTLTREPNVATILRIMLESHEAAVDYMTPLGLHHIMWGGHHYGPAPWWDTYKRDDWNPVYYHRADCSGLASIARRPAATRLASIIVRCGRILANLNTCPEQFLLWFHHVPWES